MMRKTAPPRILVVALRYLGDVLLTTPLPHALRQHYPGCEVDMLVFKGTEGMLQNNPDVRRVYTIAERPARGEIRALARELWRRYDLAVVPQPGDKPHLFGFVAARQRIGLVPTERSHSWWKRLLLRHALSVDGITHRIRENEQVVQLLGVPAARTVIPPSGLISPAAWTDKLSSCVQGAAPFDPRQPFAVIHPSPRWRYKRWHTAGWASLMDELRRQGLRLLLSGGPGEAEGRYLDEVVAALNDPTRAAVIRIQGCLGLGELADLLRLARLYVGPDTATTHLAAASGTPTLALFGPTEPRQWGPSPPDGLEPPWNQRAPRQVRGNVVLLQEPFRACVPCQQEGCERHRDSHAECLDRLAPERVRQEAVALLRLHPGDQDAVPAPSPEALP
ncbi:glycosyltransferase family 9 protein [Pigmentiphaga sp.]|uniref:glycosyltransferase family 9 protein n=1 Tax=Pigmentiphaga sp. TaxID=1977564 RepID=UPI0025F8D1CA|nr:glycosyltransferase family 9 protein [Pigmentiphaga sp.]